VQEHRRREMIEAATPQAAVDALVGRLLAHGLFGEWAHERHVPVATAPARVLRAGARDVLVVAETLECGSLLPLWGGMGEGERAEDSPPPRPPQSGGKAPHSPVRPVTFELLRKAVEIAGQIGGSVSVLLAGADAAGYADTLAAHGADRVLIAEDDAHAAGTEAFAALLTDVIRAQQPGLVILPSTVFGRDVAPRVAARLGLGLTGECIDLSVDAEGRVLQHKPAFGGSVVALIASRTRPEMATVRPGMLPPAPPQPERRAEVVRLAGAPAPDRVRVVARQASAAAAAELEEAEAVVGFGKGIGGPEQLPLMQALADVLGGTICTTRDVTDAGWLPRQYQVGMTGRAISPQLYIAIAVRGAFEHTVGIRRSGLIVAINKSPKAPIFKAADYGVVGDFAVIVPALIDALRAARAAVAAGGAAQPR
jgi:electron transfer flavoprotein alpha subunit